ncbi:MAG: nucleotidyltransferase family protein [Armatimonadota bacterium]|nr:nucleotidyltransferase family protein [Armatimonadota bacterium]
MSPVSRGDILIACLIEPDAEPPRPGPPLSELVAGCDLAWLPHAAHYHGIAGYVYRALKELPGIDPRTLASLETLYRLGLGRHLRAIGDLSHLQAVLDRASVRWLVADGPVLAETGYPRPDLRAYDGVHLVIPREALSVALLTLEGAGCLIRRRGESLRASRVDLTLRYGTAACLRCHIGDSADGAPEPDSPGSGIFDRARRVRLASTVVATLDAADALIFLAARATEDSSRLGLLKDVERILATTPISWEEVVLRSRTWGLAGSAGAALRRARQVLSAPVPPDVIRALANGTGHLPSKARRPLGQTDGQPMVSSASILLHLIHVDPNPLPQDLQIDWDGVVRLAVRERLAPLAFVGLDRARAPDFVRSMLAQPYREAVASAADAYWQAVEALRVLRAEGITPIPLKGAAMAQFVYRDVGLRPFVDLDFLVRAEQIDAVHRALQAAGYAMVGERPTDADLTWRHGRAYFDPSGHRISVDVHWRYLGYPWLMPFDFEGVFARAAEASLGEEPVLLAAPCDMIVATSAYFLRELWYGKPKLRYLRDLAELSVRSAVDWDCVINVAAATPRIRPPLYLTLAAAAGLLGAAVPEEVLERLRPRRKPRVTSRLEAAVSRNILRIDSPIQAVGQVALMRWIDEPSLTVMLRWLLALLFVPRPLASSQRRWLQRIWRR